MGIRRKTETIQWKINIPIELAVEIELLLANPVLGKPIYGARSQLITELLQRYLSQVKVTTNDHHNI